MPLLRKCIPLSGDDGVLILEMSRLYIGWLFQVYLLLWIGWKRRQFDYFVECSNQSGSVFSVRPKWQGRCHAITILNADWLCTNLSTSKVSIGVNLFVNKSLAFDREGAFSNQVMESLDIGAILTIFHQLPPSMAVIIFQKVQDNTTNALLIVFMAQILRCGDETSNPAVELLVNERCNSTVTRY